MPLFVLLFVQSQKQGPILLASHSSWSLLMPNKLFPQYYLKHSIKVDAVEATSPSTVCPGRTLGRHFIWPILWSIVWTKIRSGHGFHLYTVGFMWWWLVAVASIRRVWRLILWRHGVLTKVLVAFAWFCTGQKLARKPNDHSISRLHGSIQRSCNLGSW